jgi:hypothetical protein
MKLFRTTKSKKLMVDILLIATFPNKDQIYIYIYIFFDLNKDQIYSVTLTGD